MRYLVKWRAQGDEPLHPEEFSSETKAKERVRELLNKYGQAATIDVWNADETWQIVSPAGVEAWCSN